MKRYELTASILPFRCPTRLPTLDWRLLGQGKPRTPIPKTWQELFESLESRYLLLQTYCNYTEISYAISTVDPPCLSRLVSPTPRPAPFSRLGGRGQGPGRWLLGAFAGWDFGRTASGERRGRSVVGLEVAECEALVGVGAARALKMSQYSIL